MTKTLDFYFDFTSGYGFLASQTIDTLAHKIGRQVIWRPFLIGAVYKEFGVAPLNNPSKFEYFKKDLARSAKLLDIGNVTWPDNFPGSPIPASRGFIGLKHKIKKKRSPSPKKFTVSIGSREPTLLIQVMPLKLPLTSAIRKMTLWQVLKTRM